MLSSFNVAHCVFQFNVITHFALLMVRPNLETVSWKPGLCTTFTKVRNTVVFNADHKTINKKPAVCRKTTKNCDLAMRRTYNMSGELGIPCKRKNMKSFIKAVKTHLPRSRLAIFFGLDRFSGTLGTTRAGNTVIVFSVLYLCFLIYRGMQQQVKKV